LTLPAATQLLQPISGRHPQILQRYRRIEHPQFSQCRSTNVTSPPPYRLAVEQALRIAISKGADHTL
jgi:hypothetical protein